jgi:tRNA U34 5-carboxymethylaminomethyl modifying enzyme MnmG/GidA
MFKRWFLFKQVGWFSFDPEFHIERDQMCCYLTRTTKETHQIVRDNLDETPTYGGWVEAKGPRYCPAIEDKRLFTLWHNHEDNQTIFASDCKVQRQRVPSGIS